MALVMRQCEASVLGNHVYVFYPLVKRARCLKHLLLITLWRRSPAKAQPGMDEPSDCDDTLCSEACYQHGGADGGKCDDDGQCICSKPHGSTHLYEQVPAGNQSKIIPHIDQV